MVLVLELLHAAFASPRLAVRAVRIAGTRQLTPQHVGALAGVRAGANVLSVNLGETRRRVLRDPAVREARVTRALPDAIRITIEERTPQMAAAWGGRFWEVDATGIPFRERGDAPAGLPLVDLGAGPPPALGTPLPADRWQAVRQCAELARARRLPLRKILFDDHGELWLNIAVQGRAADGERLLPVRFGRLDGIAEKMAQLRWVLTPAAANGAYLDLMCPGRPAYGGGKPDARGGTGTWRRPAPASASAAVVVGPPAPLALQPGSSTGPAPAAGTPQ